eukprot:1139913-Pelagomonas_calceolata.AAC.2
MRGRRKRKQKVGKAPAQIGVQQIRPSQYDQPILQQDGAVISSPSWLTTWNLGLENFNDCCDQKLL